MLGDFDREKNNEVFRQLDAARQTTAAPVPVPTPYRVTWTGDNVEVSAEAATTGEIAALITALLAVRPATRP